MPAEYWSALVPQKGNLPDCALDSVIMCDNLATVLETEIDSSLGRLPDLGSIAAALRHTLAL